MRKATFRQLPVFHLSIGSVSVPKVSKRKSILKDPNTSIQQVLLFTNFLDKIKEKEFMLLVDFIRSNQNLEYLWIAGLSGCRNLERLRSCVAAAYENDGIKFVNLAQYTFGSASLSPSKEIEILDLIPGTSTKVTRLCPCWSDNLLSPSDMDLVSSLFSSKMGRIQQLSLHCGRQAIMVLVCLSKMETTSLQKLELVASRTIDASLDPGETLNAVATFLRSQSSSCLTFLHLRGFQNVGQQHSAELLNGLTSAQHSLQTLELKCCEFDQGSVFLNQLFTGMQTITKLAIGENSMRFDSEHVQQITNGIRPSHNLKSLYLNPIQWGNVSHQEIMNLLLAISSSNIEDLGMTLLVNVGLSSSLFQGTRDMLCQPQCTLKSLRLKAYFSNKQVLALLLAAQSCTTLISVHLGYAMKLSPCTWRSVALLLPSLQWTAFTLIGLEGYPDPEEEEGQWNWDGVKDAVLDGVTNHQCLEGVDFSLFCYPNEPNFEDVYLRNKTMKGARALESGQAPLSLSPHMMATLDCRSKYIPEAKDHCSRKATLLYSLLRTRPCTEVMDAVQNYMVPKDTGSQPALEVTQLGDNTDAGANAEA